jgi:hypothetical protein
MTQDKPTAALTARLCANGQWTRNDTLTALRGAQFVISDTEGRATCH